ncbi:hypothetical protein EVAR_59298_1 [Eumeta japonica]|uniref:Mariner Mos1 transposase n=1 Tax=Eumeta variegata TaxID=151549 RepID=A0A4C1YBY4_EUMVA|nr:hypothetical protein EVAR_59298_1 [Eumeta japonica]
MTRTYTSIKSGFPPPATPALVSLPFYSSEFTFDENFVPVRDVGERSSRSRRAVHLIYSQLIRPSAWPLATTDLERLQQCTNRMLGFNAEGKKSDAPRRWIQASSWISAVYDLESLTTKVRCHSRDRTALCTGPPVAAEPYNCKHALFEHGKSKINVGFGCLLTERRDEFRDGRLSTAANNKNIDAVRRMMATVALENCRIVNSDWYTTICVPEVIDALCKNNRKLRTFLHHDNASSHTTYSSVTNNFLKEKNVEPMSSLAYSPEIASCDFFSQKLRINYAVNDFHHQENLFEEHEKHVSQVTSEEWHK